ncbi:MAG: tetratricopeptide repeat protein, partial [Thermoguttaceae bacterium]
MFSCQKFIVLAIAACLFSPLIVLADDSGQDDLDKAVQYKLKAKTITDLGEVIRLAESALQKGLDESNTVFAKQLLASSLVQRGTVVASIILKTTPPDPRWAQFRQIALADLDKAVKLAPNQPQTLFLIAQLNLLPKGNEKRAKEALEQTISLTDDDPRLRAKALVLRASMEKELEKRLPDLNEAVRLAPMDAANFHARGRVLAELGKFKESLDDLNKAIELNGNNVPTYNDKAKVLTRMKKYEEALAALDQSQKLAPNSIEP